MGHYYKGVLFEGQSSKSTLYFSLSPNHISFLSLSVDTDETTLKVRHLMPRDTYCHENCVEHQSGRQYQCVVREVWERHIRSNIELSTGIEDAWLLVIFWGAWVGLWSKWSRTSKVVAPLIVDGNSVGSNRKWMCIYVFFFSA